MPYTYDVFISYRNLPDHSQWVQQHFHPLLHGCLENLSGKRTIFRDKVSIDAGDNWNQAIRSAIRSSRIMIALLTPRYFESTWCVAEWQSFVAREKRNRKTRHKLLIPVKVSNGDFFPRHAMDRQFTDATDFTDVFRIVMTETHRSNLEERTILLARLILSRLEADIPPHSRFDIVDPKTVRMPRLRSPGKPLQ